MAVPAKVIVAIAAHTIRTVQSLPFVDTSTWRQHTILQKHILQNNQPRKQTKHHYYNHQDDEENVCRLDAGDSGWTIVQIYVGYDYLWKKENTRINNATADNEGM